MIILFLALAIDFAHADWVEIGSMNSTENQIVVEIVAQTIEKQARIEVKRSSGANSETAFRAMADKRIDLYVDYSGALAEVVLKRPELKSITDINLVLSSQRVRLSNSLGFKKPDTPAYEGVVAAREDLIRRLPKAWEAVKSLEGRLTDEKLNEMKRMVDVDKMTSFEVAQTFIRTGGADSTYVIWVYVLIAALIGLSLAIYLSLRLIPNKKAGIQAGSS